MTAIAIPRRRFTPRRLRDARRSFTITFILVVALAAFLSPLLRSVMVSLKTPAQLAETNAPFLPSVPQTFTLDGKDYEVYVVPLLEGSRPLALVKPGRQQSDFLDPANPAAGPITWQGSWRTLERAWTLQPAWQNYADVWDLIDFPRLLFNTIAISLIGMVGVVVSCTLVAYGFARYRFPGRSLLFTILIATIFLPAAVTIIPTYTMFSSIGWVGTWLPLLVPTFFANAYDVFLLRQYLLTIPREMDEAAAIDGAGPMRTLVSVILPQAWPVVVAVAIFHLVYSWNDFFNPLIYLSTKPELQPLAVGLQRFNGIHYRNPAYVQAGTLMTMVIPVVLFLIFQRVFIRGVVITGVEKVTAAAGAPFRVALTFDAESPDRPAEPGVTARILDTLRDVGVPATAFLQGRWVEAEPALARRFAEEGHLVGNHSHHHARMTMLTAAGLRGDVLAAQRVIAAATGVSPAPWFRCPFGAGARSRRVVERLAALGYVDVAWDVDGLDWAGGSAARVAGRVVRGTLARGDGAVVLLHGWPVVTPLALGTAIQRLRAEGATFVRIDELPSVPGRRTALPTGAA